MGRTLTDFSQLSRGMFKKGEPVVEVKPPPPKKAAGDDALAYFGLKAPEAPTCAPGGGADNGRIQSLEANVAALRAESAALGAAKDAAEKKASDLERQLAAERAARQSAEAERERLRGDVLRLRNELEEALTAPGTGNGEWGTGNGEPDVPEVRVQGLLKHPKTGEVFNGEVREHVLAALSEAQEAAGQSGRERRAKVLEDVLAANAPVGELELRRAELKQIIKDTGSFVDARTIAALEKIGFKCVSGNKHWKLDFADIRIPISKTPSDYRSALNTATSIANMCF